MGSFGAASNQASLTDSDIHAELDFVAVNNPTIAFSIVESQLTLLPALYILFTSSSAARRCQEMRTGVRRRVKAKTFASNSARLALWPGTSGKRRMRSRAEAKSVGEAEVGGSAEKKWRREER